MHERHFQMPREKRGLTDALGQWHGSNICQIRETLHPMALASGRQQNCYHGDLRRVD
jgi:hypothetical protein